MGKAIGPTFGDEILSNSAITDRRFGWGAEGNFSFPDDFPADVRAAVLAAYEAHDPTSPENARGDEIDAVTVDRDRRLSGGYQDATTGKTIQTDDKSQGRLTGVGATALALVVLTQGTATLTLIAADNTVISLPATDMLALIQGRVFPWVAAHFTHANDLKQQIRAGGHPDVSAGWPG